MYTFYVQAGTYGILEMSIERRFPITSIKLQLRYNYALYIYAVSTVWLHLIRTVSASWLVCAISTYGVRYTSFPPTHGLNSSPS